MCEKCEKQKTKAVREHVDFPTLALRAEGLYKSERMTLSLFRGTISAENGVVMSEIGRVALQSAMLFPRHLHRLPGRPMNAYVILKDAFVIFGCDDVATPPSTVFSVQYEDLTGTLHHLTGGSIIAAAGMLGGATSPTSSIIIPSTTLGELPTTLGNIIIYGTLSVGSATEFTYDVFVNVGIVYGSPE